MVFGLFGKKKREREMHTFFGMMQAVQEAKQKERNSSALEAVISDYNLATSPSEKPESTASIISGLLTRLVIDKAGWNTDALSKDQEFVAMIVMFVACDHVSRLASADFEMCTVVTPIHVFGAVRSTLVVGRIGEVGAEFNRLATDPQDSRIIMTIGRSFANWISYRDDDDLDRIAELMKVMVEATS